MITVKESIRRVVLLEVIRQNAILGDEMCMVVAKEIVKDRVKDTKVINGLEIVNMMEYESDKGNEEIHGAWLYRPGTPDDADSWVFEKCSTIAEAVKKAVYMLDVQIICDGEVISYDSYSDTQAYYIDKRDNKVKIVDLDN